MSTAIAATRRVRGQRHGHDRAGNGEEGAGRQQASAADPPALLLTPLFAPLGHPQRRSW
jgi:hypothetical protein